MTPFRRRTAALIAAACLAGLPACGEDDVEREAGKAGQEAEKAGEKAKEAGEDAKREAEKAKDDVDGY